MATDQQSRTIDAESDIAGAAIENEIPTYRAISVRAIFALACGVLSVFSFIHSIFYVFAVLAVAIGIWAHRTIKRFPDMLTGRGLASAGIGLGLICGLSAGTFAAVQYVVRSKQATLFAAKYATVLESGDMGQFLWYNGHPDMRKDKSGADLIKELDSIPRDKRMMQMSVGPMAQLNKLHSRITSTKGQHVRFVRLEGVGDDEGRTQEMQVFALALFEINGPVSKEFPEEKQYVLAVLKAKPSGRQFEWWSENVVFPYTPSTFVAPAKPVGDGHDHGGGGH